MSSLPVSERPSLGEHHGSHPNPTLSQTLNHAAEQDAADPDLNPEQPKILIVDDRPDNLRLLHSMLTQAGYDVRRAINGSTALMGVRAAMPDLILLDINMPGMDGYEVCQHLKQDTTTDHIPVIFLSALDEGLDKVKAFSVGGVDYITKPFEVMEVLARVENHLEAQARKAEIQALNSQLEARVQERTAQLLATKQALEVEAIELEKAKEQLAHMAWHDPLTDLPNRAWLMKALNRAVERVQKHPDQQFAVLFLDCDRFKLINDSLGHLVGDQLLIAVAQRLTQDLPTHSTLTRFGGDEFTLLLDQIESPEQAEQAAQLLLDALVPPFHLGQHEVFTTASIGIALGNATYDRPEAILRDADIAMYRAKALGKSQYQCFDAAMHEAAQAQLQLETDLRRAIERQEFEVYYQPIINLKTLGLAGFEALVRWHHPTRGLIRPNQFITAAEEAGLIVPLGQWVMQEACQQLSSWQTALQTPPSQHPLVSSSEALRMSVNLSVKQFVQPDLLEQIDRFLATGGLSGDQLTLEITESVLMDNHDYASDMLQRLHDRNIRLAIDDFGTGYSSLSYLHQFPVDVLKIDQMFVSRIADPDNGFSIVEATLVMAHSLGIQVVAEGVETVAQARQLQLLGCDYAQGFWFTEPLTAEVAHQMLMAPFTFELV